MVKRRVDGQRMLVISLDAVGSRDLEYMRSLPNFKKIWTSNTRRELIRMIIEKLKDFLKEKKRQIKAKKRLENFKKRIVELDKKTKKMRKNSSLVLSSSKSV